MATKPRTENVSPGRARELHERRKPLEDRFAEALGVEDRTELAHRLGALADLLLERKHGSARLEAVDRLKHFQRAYRGHSRGTPEKALAALER